MRELVEETGLTVPGLQFAGLAEFELADGRRHYGAVYAGAVDSPDLGAFEPNANESSWR